MTPDSELEGADAAVDDADEAAPDPAREPAVGAPARGPYDVSDVEDAGDRLNLGSLLVRGVAGMELQLQVDEASGQVVAVHAVLEQSALQLQPFAAPRSQGIWDEVRGEIRAGLTGQGGTCEEVQGPFGTELRAQVPAQLPDGRHVLQDVRFLGVDGPRWFLRGVISGAGAVDPDAAAALETVFAETVVVRGDAPMAPRDPIPLQVPQAPSAEGGSEAEGSEGGDAEGERSGGREPLEPFKRGPEITEVR